MKKGFIAGTLLCMLAFSIKSDIIGRWETPISEKGHVTGVVFKADNSFEGYVDKKPFTSGIYDFHDDVLSFTDNGCEGKRATYKIVFFSYGDSLRFVPITDSCEPRRNGMSKLIMGRVK